MFKKFPKKYLLYAAVILAFNILSYMAIVWPILNNICFILIAVACLIFTLKNLFWGYLFLLAELISNSMGYLFAWDFGGFSLSLRIVLWAIVMSVWLLNFLKDFKTINFKAIVKDKIYLLVGILIVFALLGLIMAKLNGNSLDNIFFDANNWLYWSLLLPAIKSFNKSNIGQAIEVIVGAMIVSFTQSVWLLYAFSHNILDENSLLYAWVRDTRLGEITLMANNYYRVFIQAQVFLLPAFFFIFAHYLNKKEVSKQNIAAYILVGSLALSPLIIGLSRSFWFGLFGAWLAFNLIFKFYQKINWKKIISVNFMMLGSLAVSVIILVGAVKFPCPKSLADVSAGAMLTERAGAVKNEAGASSRWTLLAELKKEIAKAPILGEGFGKTVTYISSDQRILEKTAKGEYTTFAFEWGWLDIWLKIGLGGLLVYLLLLFYIIKDLLKTKKVLQLSLAVGVVAIIFVNMFSPYLNHPLGIGFLIFCIAVLKSEKLVVD